MGGRIHIISDELMTGIDASSQENARFATIQIRCAEEIFRGTMTITVTPGCVKVGLIVLETFQGIVHRDVGHTRCTIHIDQVFGALMHKPVGTATCSRAVVLRGIADDVCLAIGSMNGGSVSSTHDGFCLTVQIPVVSHDVLLVILEIAHIRAAVHPP